MHDDIEKIDSKFDKNTYDYLWSRCSCYRVSNLNTLHFSK